MIFSSRNYAVGLAHYQIAGGNRGLTLLVSGYIAVMSVVFGLILYNVQSVDIPDVMRGVSVFLLVAQAFGLVVVGSGRIVSCIRSDITSNMMESHRLMPITSWRVVLAYMLGTTSQLLSVLVVNAIVLLVTESIGHIPFESFVLSQMVLAFFAIFVWSFMAMCGFMFKQALPLMVFGLIFGGVFSAFLRSSGILPPLAILGTPFVGETIFNLTAGRLNPRALYAIALPAQLAFGVLFFIGACRRYRGAYTSTFNVGMGVILMTIWGGLSLVATWAWPQVMQRFATGREALLPSQIVASLVAASILAIVPTHALAAWEHARGLSAQKRALALAGAVVAASLPMYLSVNLAAWLVLLVILTLHTLTLYSAFRFTRGMSMLAAGVMAVGLLFTLWVAPLFVDLCYYLMTAPPSAPEELSAISSFSPIGSMLIAWQDPSSRPSLLWGVSFQLFVAIVAWRIGSRRIRALAAADAADGVTSSLPR
jgi:hypothetical protein